MPWFVVDDSAHTHPKVVKAGNAAIGLWMRCGSYAAQHLTDGIIPGGIATMYGTNPQAVKLIKLGLWHPAGHTCHRCPQPADGDYVMHDYHAYNPTRQIVIARREKAAEKKRRQRGEVPPEPPNPHRNGSRIADESRSNRDRIEDESGTIHRPLFDETPAHADVSRGDSLGTRARAFPSPPLLSKEQVADVEGGSTGSRARDTERPDGRPAPIDDSGFELTDAMRRWAIATFGAALNVDYETAQFVSHHRGEATRRRSWPDEWQKWLRRSAKYASERAQRHLPVAAGTGNVLHLPTGPRPSTTDARVQAALDLGRQMQAEYDAAQANARKEAQ